MPQFDRRSFLGLAGAGITTGLLGCGGLNIGGVQLIPESHPPAEFEISLAEWSLHRTLRSGEMSNLDFPKVTRETFDIGAVEYVNSFFKDKARDEAYLKDLKKRCDDHGVKSLLIMCDGEGQLGDPDSVGRSQAVENHHRWVDAAKFLGCHSIRVNAASSGSYDEQMRLAADGLSQLTEYGETMGINVIVENHGGLSSNGEWLASVMKMVNHPRCGTLPDFGNFNLGGGEMYDRYKGMKELMPFAKAVSAKSHEFDENGAEIHSDYRRMLTIVRDAGYSGYIGIEFEGPGDEVEGILATKRLLEKNRDLWWQQNIKKS
ncbi:MAG: TIM barrel protein [Planctomycetia bacterium]|jgi:L-ribulose-5-phosphate 3-epimerase|nr:TIM barrel protein [Planctomycetia bacterium]NCF99781.1 TIM barrel protein [Planctomycetia bacterium]NCG12938.1 TIM barrel protein [Planctomycetia bacterium]